MKSRIVWMTISDPSIVVEDSTQAKALALEDPTDPKYRVWTEVLVFEDEAANG